MKDLLDSWSIINFYFFFYLIAFVVSRIRVNLRDGKEINKLIGPWVGIFDWLIFNNNTYHILTNERQYRKNNRISKLSIVNIVQQLENTW